MTNQEIFDRVARHLLQQGAPAIRQGRPVIQTRRYPVRKSAIGCLIEEGRYTVVCELTPASREALLQRSGINLAESGELIEELEKIHNCECSENWLTALQSIANEFNLKPTVLEQVGAVVA
jgi:hypothetical protein